MTKEKAIKILNEIIDEGWLISDMEKCPAIDACEMAIQALELEPTTKNDLAVESDLISSITEKISEKVTENHEEFIFETIRPYCENVVQMKISKRDLEKALLKYYGKNDLGVDCISRVEVIDYLCKHCPDDGECFKDCDEIKHLRQMPSVTPQESEKE